MFTLVGLALAGLGGVLLMNNTAALTHALNIEQGVLGVAVIGVGLVLPEYVRCSKKVLDEHTKTSINAFDTCYWEILDYCL